MANSTQIEDLGSRLSSLSFLDWTAVCCFVAGSICEESSWEDIEMIEHWNIYKISYSLFHACAFVFISMEKQKSLNHNPYTSCPSLKHNPMWLWVNLTFWVYIFARFNHFLNPFGIHFGPPNQPIHYTKILWTKYIQMLGTQLIVTTPTTSSYKERIRITLCKRLAWSYGR